MTEPLVDLRTLLPSRRAMTRPHRSKKVYALESDEPIGSYRELIAREIANGVKGNDTLTEIHARFCARMKCPVCGLLAICCHRDRVSEIRLITGYMGGV